MRLAAMAIWLPVLCAIPTQAKDLSGQVKKAVKKSTLDQRGTRPFHLKAEYAPTLERDKDSNRAGK